MRKQQVLVLLGILLFFYFVILFYASSSLSVTPKIDEKVKYKQVNSASSPYVFDRPSIAEKVLNLLDVPEPVPKDYFNNDNPPVPRFQEGYLSLTWNENYCKEVHHYLALRSDEVFRQAHFFSDRYGHVRRIMKGFGVDIMPEIREYMEDQDIRKYDLKPNIHNFFVSGPMHKYQLVGQSFACTFQAYDHIPGHALFNRKDLLSESVSTYSKKYIDRPHCFNFSNFFPETWLLHIKSQCIDFFNNHFNTKEYFDLKAKYKIIYIRKLGKGPHLGEGVNPVNEEEEKAIREEYDNGRKCGEIKKNRIIQKFIYNPLLIDGRKMDFRVYMLIASVNPLIAYYHDGYAKVSLTPYDVTSTEKSTLITNVGFDEYLEQAAQGEKPLGMNAKQLREAHFWSFERIQEYLLKVGKITDPNWLDNYLRPSFKKAFIHLLRATSGPFVKFSQTYELVGADFMLDDDLNLWIIECNTKPRLQPYTMVYKSDREPFFSVISDEFDIVFALARSRLKRAIKYINKIVNDLGDIGNDDPVELSDLEEKIQEFREITKNRFEPEFQPKPFNTFSKFVDENLEGPERYAGLIEPDCL